MRTVRIAGVRIGALLLGQIVPFLRLLAAVGALDAHEERVVRMARAQLLHVLQRRLDLEGNFHHFEQVLQSDRAEEKLGKSIIKINAGLFIMFEVCGGWGGEDYGMVSLVCPLSCFNC